VDGQLNDYRFILNGLRHANEILGKTAFVEEGWKVIGEYVFDGEGGRHQAFYAPLRDTVVLGELIRPHERIKVEQSLKYAEQEARWLWNQAGLTEIGQWRHEDEYGKWPCPVSLTVGLALWNSGWPGCFPFQQSDQAFHRSTPRFSDTWDQSYDVSRWWNRT
jgi:hypothetical protein